ncbi:hypothetical protein PHYPSEUDO_014145 [Phytophthora pseudosyringae]|uniref:Myb-like domain-containing protein n=1 Tax=Phytophthora pseudosyringae TaxID=221518 RepID=A0A8T1V5I1_9STRA|nr:hypothetical protein PHYPSEUDO_014145 [Phytophthora pseudosyringae]
MIVEARTTGDRKIRQRFGPEEDYLLAIQVNVDAPYMAEHGEVNKQWQALAGKLNGSPNFNMKAIKGTTAKARFKTLLTKHRTWESKSARKSGSDENELPFIRGRMELASSVNDYDAKTANTTAVTKGDQLAKEQSGEVVRQAAVARIRLGKCCARSDESDSEETGASPSVAQPSRQNHRSKSPPEWMFLLEESKTQRTKMSQAFLQQQQTEQTRRLDFEREQRTQGRAEPAEERKERRLEREERQKERDAQTRLIANLLERLGNDKNN